MEKEKMLKCLQDVKRRSELGTGFVNPEDREELEDMGLVDGLSLTERGKTFLKREAS